MKEVNLVEFGGENFCCYTDPMVISLDVESPKLTLITGPNGVGKTSMFDILPFTWYGITSKGIKAEDAINNKTKNNCHTWTKFYIDKDYYEAHRYYKYKSLGSTCMLFKNKAKKPYKKGHREVKEEMENLIMPQKLFMNVLFFGQKVKSFFTDLGDADQKEIFRKILSLEMYLTWYEQTKKLLKESEARYNELDKEITLQKGLLGSSENGIAEQIELENQFYVKLKSSIELLETELDEYRDLLTQAEEEYAKEFGDKDLEDIQDQLNQKLADVNSRIANIDSELETISKGIDAQGTIKLNEVRQQVATKKAELLEEMNKKLTMIEHDQTLERVRKGLNLAREKKLAIESTQRTIGRDISDISSEMSKFKSALENNEEYVCPTCDQTVGADKAEEFKVHLKELEDMKSPLLEKLDDLNSEFTEITQLINDSMLDEGNLMLMIDDEQKKIRVEYSDSIKTVDEKLQNATFKINAMVGVQKQKIQDEKLEEKRSLQSTKLSIVDAKTKLNGLINRHNRMFEDISSLQTKIKYKEKSLADTKDSKFDKTTHDNLVLRKIESEKAIKDSEAEYEKTAIVMESLEFWKDGFSSKGIPSMLIDEAIPYMNERIRYYLDKIDGGRYVVSFDTMQATKAGEFRDKINVMVLDTETLSDKREKFSGGQTRIVDIATILTLCDLQSNVQHVKFNILLFDEIFDSLDDSNIGYVSNILRSISKERSIFLISHRHIDQIEADDVLSFS